VFAARDGRFTSQYSRTFVEAAQRIPTIPRMTPAQDEALDLLAAVCDELGYEMELEPGDIQLLNNHVIYHGRTAYEDAPEPGHDRRDDPAAGRTPEPEPGVEAIAGIMGCAAKTVEAHRANVYRKWKVHTRIELFKRALELQVVKCPHCGVGG